MRKISLINDNWFFTLGGKGKGEEIKVTIPHTWNNIDGQDGGSDYLRTQGYYRHTFQKPELRDDEVLFAQFEGVNTIGEVFINGEKVAHHEGGYSTFRADLTPYLKDGDNLLEVIADNTYAERIYPQAADFTFYGGIYRHVSLIQTNRNHFALTHFGSKGVKTEQAFEGKDAILTITPDVEGEGTPYYILKDHEGNVVAESREPVLRVKDAHLWNGIHDPYLYTLTCELRSASDEVLDDITEEIGFRFYSVDPKKGFILNGKPYSLRGTSRHQDVLGLGNALTQQDMEKDIDIMKDIGLTSVRLAHYQHNEYFYTLCDRAGFVVWSEIPYISQHLDAGDDNAIEQMRELILQTYNHASICFRCLSNEITMKKAGKDRLAFHKKLNAFTKENDPSRLTCTAGFAAIGAFNPLNTIADVFSYNFYFGWYTPFTWLNDIRLDFYHLFHAHHAVGLSEYGAEGMPNLHSKHPKRMDNSEEYQAIYHEKLLKIIEKRPWLWSTYVWNLFDFGSDGRNQGGDPGKNHKGLVTFDRALKKDAYYIYKAYWSKDPFVHLCGSRFEKRTGNKMTVKAYTNQDKVTLFLNGKERATKSPKNHIVTFSVPLGEKNEILVKSGELTDSASFIKVSKEDPSYECHTGNSYSWEKKKAQTKK